MMRAERLVWLTSLVAGLGMLLVVSPATAQDCTRGCRTQKAAAATAVRQAALACKQECRATTAGAERRGCLRMCAINGRAAKVVNRVQHADCKVTCNPPLLPTAIDGSCLASCGRDLATCAAQVMADATSCLRGCKSSSDPLACVQGCAATVQGGVATCATAFGGCAGTCVPPPPTPTPTTPPSACRDTCLTDAESCLVGIGNAGKSCVEHCATAAYPAAMACLHQPDVEGCLMGVAQQAVPCVQRCEPAAVTAAQTCGSTLNGCVQACPPDPCRDACIGSLEGCAGSLLAPGETCINSCATAAAQAAAPCLSPLNVPCLMGIGQHLEQCATGCANSALASGQACKGSYLGCEQQCGP